jgi:dephospho-CoA kinase
MLLLGLTGGLAMGKSTVAAMFGEEGAAVFDADKAVHALYAGKAVPLIEAAFPGTTANGSVDRQELGTRVAGDPAALARLEAIVHPLVWAVEAEFTGAASRAGHRFAILDIPLLFETGADRRMDAVIVASTSPETQRQRLAGRGIRKEQFEALIARQMSDADKRARAHFVIDTSGPFAATREQVRGILRALAARAAAGQERAPASGPSRPSRSSAG